jgi:hypothetical protein
VDGSCNHGNEPSGFINSEKLLSSCTIDGFSRTAQLHGVSLVIGIFFFLPQGANWNAYTLLVGKPEGKRPLGRPRRRLVDNIRMDLGEVGWGDVDWIGLAQDRNRWRALVNSVLNLRVA